MSLLFEIISISKQTLIIIYLKQLRTGIVNKLVEMP